MYEPTILGVCSLNVSRVSEQTRLYICIYISCWHVSPAFCTSDRSSSYFYSVLTIFSVLPCDLNESSHTVSDRSFSVLLQSFIYPRGSFYCSSSQYGKYCTATFPPSPLVSRSFVSVWGIARWASTAAVAS